MIVFQWIAVPLATLLFLHGAWRLLRGDRPRWSLALATLFWLAAATAIAWPELTNAVAGWLGIGRGADLLIYLTAISFFVSFLYFYRKHARIESAITEIVRELAIRQAEERDLGLGHRAPDPDTRRETGGNPGNATAKRPADPT